MTTDVISSTERVKIDYKIYIVCEVKFAVPARSFRQYTLSSDERITPTGRGMANKLIIYRKYQHVNHFSPEPVLKENQISGQQFIFIDSGADF